mgnify:CR=1 FL=1
MLEYHGSEAFDSLQSVPGSSVGKTVDDVYVPVTAHVATLSRHAETALRYRDLFTALGHYPDVRVDIDRLAFLVESLHCHYPARHTDLRSGNPHAILLRRCDR